MKKTILIIMFILCLPLAFALYGGETWRYHFDECDELRVNITATDMIDEGEYEILNDCTEISDNYYTCECNNNYDFNVSFKINTVNNYTFDFNYDYSRFEQEESKPSGGSSRGSSGAFTIRFETNKPRTLMLKPNIISRFWINSKQHTIKVTDINSDNEIKIKIDDKPSYLFLNRLKTKELDGEILELTLTRISGNIVYIKFEKINRKVINETIKIDDEIIDDKKVEPIKDIELPIDEDEPIKSNKVFWLTVILISLVVIIVLIGLYIHKLKKKKDEEKKGE